MGDDEACCGIPMKVAGKWDVFEEIYLHNTTEARKRGAKTIVTSCPACGLVWKELYANLARERGEEYEFEVKHYSEFAAEAIADGRLCSTTRSTRRSPSTTAATWAAPRATTSRRASMLKAIPGVELVEMEHNREDGAVLRFGAHAGR